MTDQNRELNGILDDVWDSFELPDWFWYEGTASETEQTVKIFARLPSLTGKNGVTFSCPRDEEEIRKNLVLSIDALYRHLEHKILLLAAHVVELKDEFTQKS